MNQDAGRSAPLAHLKSPLPPFAASLAGSSLTLTSSHSRVWVAALFNGFSKDLVRLCTGKHGCRGSFLSSLVSVARSFEADCCSCSTALQAGLSGSRGLGDKDDHEDEADDDET